LPKSAVDVISSAFEHTQKQLTQPFRFGQWARLALLALATGEMSSGGGCNSSWKGLGNWPAKFPHPAQNFADPGDVLSRLGLDPAVLVSIALVLVLGFMVLGLVWLYVSSISRFILFEAVLRKHAQLNAGWKRWHSQGIRYFGWQLALVFIGMAIAGVLFIPLLIPVFAALKSHQQPGPALFLAFLPMLLVFAAFGLFALLIAVLSKDFVVPLMAVDEVGVIEGWRRLLDMMKVEKGSYVLYIVLKVVLAIGAAVVFGVLNVIVLFMLLLPVGSILALFFVLGKAAHLAWDAFTITAAIVAGVTLISLFLSVVALVGVPVTVFFPAYAMHFFAERYPALHALLYPPPPATEPPPLPP
jgi:hypothetical protein